MHLLPLLLSATLALAHPPQHPLTPVPPPTSPSNPSFIFTSLHGLLRQIPNSLAPNGFSILPATIPAYTNLYHARKDSGTIPKVEWVAFDAEMSYGIMGGRGGETWLHTYVTTRDVRVLLFDGMSAALGESGTLDAQMVFLYGEVGRDKPRWGRPGEGGGCGQPGGPVLGEYKRAEDLCRWAAELGGEVPIEGFVRMNTGFEMVWCDFEGSDSWRLVSKLNVTAAEAPGRVAVENERPSPPEDGYGPPLGYGGMPWANNAGWEWIRSATWHYSLSPEARVVPDLCRFFTFYSPQFASFPNDLVTRKGSAHRLVNVTKEDAAAFKGQIADSLRADEPCSGLDWRRVTQDIMDRYGGRIMELKLVLENNATNATMKASQAVLLAFAAVMPFVNESLPNGAQERCSRAYTEFVPEERLGTQEYLLRDTIEVVMGRICSLFLGVHFEGLEGKRSEGDVASWKEDTEALVEWLDWDMWRQCETPCAWGEVCVIAALWPVLGLMDAEDWKEPRCVNSSVVERHGRRPQYPPGGGGRRPTWTM